MSLILYQNRRGSGIGNGSSEKVVNQLLTELDGVEELENVMIIAATNRKDLIDPAIIRPGRIEAHVELLNPDKKTIEEIFKIHTRNMPLDKNISLKDLSEKVIGWNGADIESACRRAGLNSIKRNYEETDMKKLRITNEDFKRALIEVGKSIGKEIVDIKNQRLKKIIRNRNMKKLRKNKTI